MKTNLRLKNLNELKATQAGLKAEQRILEKEIISTGKRALIRLPMASLLKPSDPLKMLKVNGKINLPAKVFSYLLPQIIHRTLFSRSNFLTKIITALTARKIGKRLGPKIIRWLKGLMASYFRNAKAAKYLTKQNR